MMIARHLLTDSEAATLEAYGGFKPLLALVWAMDEARALVGDWAKADPARHRDLGQGMRDEFILNEFRDVIFKFRGHCGQIVNLLSQPIPFPYFHLLHVIMLAQLLLLAYTLGTYDGLAFYLAIPSMAIITTILIGLRSLAAQLSNPFGDDLTDFPLEAFMMGAFKNSKALLMAEPHEAWNGRLPSGMENPLEPAPAIADPKSGKKGRRKNKEAYWGKPPNAVKWAKLAKAQEQQQQQQQQQAAGGGGGGGGGGRGRGGLPQPAALPPPRMGAEDDYYEEEGEEYLDEEMDVPNQRL